MKKYLFIGMAAIVMITAGYFIVIKNTQESESKTSTVKKVVQEKQIKYTAKNCTELKDEINSMLDQTNYCYTNEDCVFESRYYYPFGCWQIFNKKADLSVIDQQVKSFSDNCGYVYDSGCELDPPTANDIKCSENKCIFTKKFIMTQLECKRLKAKISVMLNPSKSCEIDNDCTFKPSDTCAFGCWQIFNKKFDLSEIDKEVKIFNENNCQYCAGSKEKCEKTTPKANLVKCIDHVCVDTTGMPTNPACSPAGQSADEYSFGRYIGPHKCCEGLTSIPDQDYGDGKCLMKTDVGSICSDCGNNICEEWENHCNCSRDCP